MTKLSADGPASDHAPQGALWTAFANLGAIRGCPEAGWEDSSVGTRSHLAVHDEIGNEHCVGTF